MVNANVATANAHTAIFIHTSLSVRFRGAQALSPLGGEDVRVQPSEIAVLWTGGKDSALALARCSDRHGTPSRLVTFVPTGEVTFKAHPLDRMRVQAHALDIEHLAIPIAEPYFESYVDALRRLRSDHGIATVVTGDIDLVNGQPNWIRECCAQADVNVLMPLWQDDRERLLREIITRGIVAEVTYVAPDRLSADWIGRRIDEQFIADMRRLSDETGIDMCGENGEYHTMVSAFVPQPSR